MVMVFVPASVRVKAPEELKRRLLIVEPLAGDWLEVRLTFDANRYAITRGCICHLYDSVESISCISQTWNDIAVLI